jgi:glycolate oxidase
MCADLAALASRLRRLLGDKAVRTGETIIVYPRSADHVRAVAHECVLAGVRFGAEPARGGVTVVTSRMRRVIEIDLPNQRAVVEPGVASVAERVPGFVAGRVTGLQACTPGGDLAWVGPAKAAETPGYDLVGVAEAVCVPTKLVVELVRAPEKIITILAAFRRVEEAAAAVTAIIAAGSTPTAMEIMDAVAIETAEHGGGGYPLGAGAALIIECAGPEVEVAAHVADIEVLCRGAGAFAIRPAVDGRDRAEIWRGRDAVFSAAGRISPSHLVEDCVVAPARLVEVLKAITELAVSAGVRVATLYRPGDGVLRALVLYNQRRSGAADAAAEVAGGIADRCAPPAPTVDDLRTMDLVRQAFETGSTL